MSEKEEKHVRRRKTQLYKNLVKQMEFYFSDANVGKDRFMTEQLEKDPYISLSVFLTFNKIKALTTSETELAKALAKSTVLELSEDKQKVCRVTEIKPKEDVDDCTIYVEQLPPCVTHEWLQSTFSEYGPVAYVALPRFKHTNKVKGFAFVEFDTPDGAKGALQAFGSAGCYLPVDMDPQELCSVKTYEEPTDSSTRTKGRGKRRRHDDSDEEQPKKKVSKKSYDDGNNGVTDDNVDDSSADAVRSSGSTEKASGHNLKQRKSTQKTNEEMTTPSDSDAGPSEEVATPNESATDICGNAAGESETRKSKKKKKRMRVHHSKEQSELVSIGLQIMSKREWKQLRNRYLNLQRSNMKAFKRQLNYQYYKTQNNQSVQPASSAPSAPPPAVEFTPGVILKVTLKEPLTDVKQFKAKAKSVGDVKYVDATEGSTEVYVRCGNSSSTELFAKSNSWPSVIILSGDEEKSYWEKINKDRNFKRSSDFKKLVKQPKIRGREKIARKANNCTATPTHIRFDD